MPHQTQLAITPDASAAVRRENIILTTDGGCWPNDGTGLGAWAFVLRRDTAQYPIERAGFERATTNNKMELAAVFEGISFLNATPGCFVTIRSDSRYLINACTVWGDKWEQNGWVLKSKPSRGQPVKNRDLIESIRDLCRRHTVRFEWVRGHSGDPDNERCDKLCSEAVTVWNNRHALHTKCA